MNEKQELAFRPAIELAALIRDGKLSSVDLLRHNLERVERVDGPLNTVVTLDAERALDQARAADDAVARGVDLGPLHGVSMTIKDSFSTAGLRTTSGAPELAEHVPDIDAAPVARLRAAGAIVFGKTNLPIWAGDVQSYNKVFGTSNNPWDTSRSVGGSSGGSAGALAAGLTPLELGSDIGGSIRNPAACCGVCGHKPSYGVVSALGQIPGPPGTLTQADIAVAGPMARTVDDLELALDLLAGADEWQGVGWRLELPPARGKRITDYRIAAWLDDESCPVGDDVSALLTHAASSLEEAGATVDRDARPDFDFEYADRVFQQLLGAALCGGYTHQEIEELAADPGRAGDLGIEHAFIRHRGWLSANERRLQMRRKWRTFFSDWDALLLPVSPTAAILHDHSQPMSKRTIDVDGVTRPYFDQMKWLGLTGVAYLPATVVPAGLTKAGLPVGIQIAGPYLEDRTTLDVARHLLGLLGGIQTPPGF